MTRDFKHSDDDASSSASASGGVFWMLSGIVIGLLVGFGVYYFTNWKASIELPVADSAKAAKALKSPVATTPPKPLINPEQVEPVDPDTATEKAIASITPEPEKSKRPNFSYYAVLPNLELDVRVQPIETIKTAVNNNIENAPAANAGDFMLQLASLKTQDRALRAQKDLANRGLAVSIQKTSVRGNKVWYRLLAGPVSDDNDLDALKRQVETLGFKPIIIKVK